MEAFFAQFPGFAYNSRTQEELEFARLCDLQGWSEASPEYKEIRKQFLQALVQETDAPVHRFFVNYVDFDYHSRASPKEEFERLRVFRRWSKTSKTYKRAKRLFQEAFTLEFDSDLDVFFCSFPGFDYNPRNEPKAEFERLRKFKKWRRCNKKKADMTEADHELEDEYRQAREDFFEAFVSVFSYFFGVAGDLKNWGFLCDILAISPVPATIEECQEKLDPFHINIYNLLDYVQEKTPIIYFPDLEKLSEYSWGHRLIYPQYRAEGTSLKFLLRRIMEFKPQTRRRRRGDVNEEEEVQPQCTRRNYTWWPPAPAGTAGAPVPAIAAAPAPNTQNP